MIKGKKVYLRAIEEEDLPFLVEMINSPDISHLVGGFSFPVSKIGQREWLTNVQNDKITERWIVSTNKGGPIGLTGLWQIDWINRHALTALKLADRGIRGKGLGTDCILTLMSYAFYQVGLNRLWGEILPYNIGSYKAYVEKCGWKVEGIYREHIYRDGHFIDQFRVAALKTDFETLSVAQDYIPKRMECQVAMKKKHLAFDFATQNLDQNEYTS